MENRKIWLIADTHFGLKGDDDEWLDDYIGYFENEVIPIMKEKVGENDILIHLGDVFDNRSSIGIHTMYSAIKLFEELTNIFNDIRICVGNHDIWQKNSNEITVLHAFKYMKNIKVYLIIKFIQEWVTQIHQKISMLLIQMLKNYGKSIFKEKMNDINAKYEKT